MGLSSVFASSASLSFTPSQAAAARMIDHAGKNDDMVPSYVDACPAPEDVAKEGRI